LGEVAAWAGGLSRSLYHAPTDPMSKGPAKRKPVTPVGGWVRGPKQNQGKKKRCLFNGVFELRSPRNAQKRDNKNRKIISFRFFVDFFVKLFETTFCNTFFAVALNSHYRETPENATKNRGKTDIDKRGGGGGDVVYF
jgi:hypothetical protein